MKEVLGGVEVELNGGPGVGDNEKVSGRSGDAAQRIGEEESLQPLLPQQNPGCWLHTYAWPLTAVFSSSPYFQAANYASTTISSQHPEYPNQINSQIVQLRL